MNIYWKSMACGAALAGLAGCAATVQPFQTPSANPPAVTAQLLDQWGVLGLMPGGYWGSDTEIGGFYSQFYWATDGSLVERQFEPGNMFGGGNRNIAGYTRYILQGNGRVQIESYSDDWSGPFSTAYGALRGDGALQRSVSFEGTTYVTERLPLSRDSILFKAVDQQQGEIFSRIPQQELQAHIAMLSRRNERSYAPLIAEAARRSEREREAFWNDLLGGVTTGLVVAANAYALANSEPSGGPRPYYSDGTPPPAVSGGSGPPPSGSSQPPAGASPASLIVAATPERRTPAPQSERPNTGPRSTFVFCYQRVGGALYQSRVGRVSYTTADLSGAIEPATAAWRAYLQSQGVSSGRTVAELAQCTTYRTEQGAIGGMRDQSTMSMDTVRQMPWSPGQ